MHVSDPDYIADLRSINACAPALDWLLVGNYPTLADAWAVCPRGDWLLWLIGATTTSVPWSDERKPLVAVAMECARTSLLFYEARTGKADVREASDVILAWTRGEASVDEAKEARKKLHAAADAAAADADDAAYAAADADDAADAAYAAYAAAADAADAADAAADADARAKALSDCADIVRKHYPMPPEASHV